MGQPFHRRALYAKGNVVQRADARAAFRRTALGRVIDGVRADYRNGVRDGAKLEQALREFARGYGPNALSTLQGGQLNGLVRDVIKYSRGGSAWKFLVRDFLKALGPAGAIIGAIADAAGGMLESRRSTGDRDIDAARRLLEVFGYETLSRPGTGTSADVKRSIAAAKAFLEAHGYAVVPPGGRDPGQVFAPPGEPGGLPPALPEFGGEIPGDTGGAGGGSTGGGTGGSGGAGAPDTSGGSGGADRGGRGANSGGRGGSGGGSGGTTGDGGGAGGGGSGGGAGAPSGDSGRGLVPVKMGNGRVQKFPASHPIVTKKKVEAPSSTNVNWYLFDVDTQTLYIRFDAPKTNERPGKRPGPLYSYAHVPPAVFLQMLAATSKGGFVWDKIRVRGTVSGHRYDYQLVAVREGYVPRKATLLADGEWYLERTIRTQNRKGQVKLLRSRASAPVTQFTNFPGGRSGPNRGRPNRGTPNRGK